MKQPISIFWFRRDLRLNDNAGLYHALRGGNPVLPVFIFDTNLLDSLENKKDKRVHFILNTLEDIQSKLKAMGSTLYVLHGTPIGCFKKLIDEYHIQTVYVNHDYEPYALQRDIQVGAYLKEKAIVLKSSKDQVIFEKNEVVKYDKNPYTVYTPYCRHWKEKLNGFYLKPYPTENNFRNFYKQGQRTLPSLAQIGFKNAPHRTKPAALDEELAKHYDSTRDFPSVDGTTRLSVHLRFGTVSIRQIAAKALALNATLLNELVWRDFYQMILWQFPYVVNGSFKKQFDSILWRNNEREFAFWCAGHTGYPIVDAGMRQLNETGFMHNRVRMITASFLTKHLLIDWRWGEAYFAEKLLDYDLAANNGGWQWSGGSGADAAPYFRIFNPYLQTQKFDPELKYIRHWVPEFDQPDYAIPIVEHKMARERCLDVYKAAMNK